MFHHVIQENTHYSLYALIVSEMTCDFVFVLSNIPSGSTTGNENMNKWNNYMYVYHFCIESIILFCFFVCLSSLCVLCPILNVFLPNFKPQFQGKTPISKYAVPQCHNMCQCHPLEYYKLQRPWQFFL